MNEEKIKYFIENIATATAILEDLNYLVEHVDPAEIVNNNKLKDIIITNVYTQCNTINEELNELLTPVKPSLNDEVTKLKKEIEELKNIIVDIRNEKTAPIIFKSTSEVLAYEDTLKTEHIQKLLRMAIDPNLSNDEKARLCQRVININTQSRYDELPRYKMS